jgi:hypothetical protein
LPLFRGILGGMKTLSQLASDNLSSFLQRHMQHRFGTSGACLTEIVCSMAQLVLGRIGNSDALYHNVEHTFLVTLAGHDILQGRAVHSHVSAEEYAHFIIACLLHDIGFVRGILQQDGEDGYVVDSTGRKVTLPKGASDAALFRYHVDRSKLFAMQCITPITSIDEQRIARGIEYTRFPITLSPKEDPDDVLQLVRAADYVGQLGDPNYIAKANALYYEFEEAALNGEFTYTSPADVVSSYPQFFWKNVYPHIQTAIDYLNVTPSGRQWIANLHSNLFRAESNVALSGPQMTSPKLASVQKAMRS